MMNHHSSQVWRRKMLTDLAVVVAAAVAVVVAVKLPLIDYVVKIVANFARMDSLERIHFAMREMVTEIFAAIENRNFGLSLFHTKKNEEDKRVKKK